MKLEYFSDGSRDCPLVLLYAGNPETVQKLSKCIADLISGRLVGFAVHELEGVQSVNGCELYFCVNKQDRGVTRTSITNEFRCQLRRESWADVAEYLEPFCGTNTPVGFQWLTTEGEINLIISSQRGW